MASHGQCFHQLANVVFNPAIFFKLIIKIEQKQKGFLYSFPLDIGLVSVDGMEIRTVEVSGKKQSYEFELPAVPGEVRLDPEVWLLYAESK